MTTSDTQHRANSQGRKLRAKASGHELLRHMASVAVVRDHPKALARHLAAGLDPQAMCYEGAQCFDYNTLLEAAAAYESVDCYFALLRAAARPSLRTMQFIFHPYFERSGSKNQGILRRLLETGSLDPRAEAWPGISCEEMATCRPNARAMDIMRSAMARLESAEIWQALPESNASRVRITRSI